MDEPLRFGPPHARPEASFDSGAAGNGEKPRVARRPADPRPDRRSEGEGRAQTDLLAPDDGASVRSASGYVAGSRESVARRFRCDDDRPGVPRGYGAPEARRAA